MLAIGRALKARPRLLLMDEPSAGLSPVIVQAMVAAIQRLRARGLAILLVEQNVGVAAALAQHAHVLLQSYLGATQYLLAPTRPPHLKASFPASASSDFHQSWVYHSGGARKSRSKAMDLGQSQIQRFGIVSDSATDRR